MDLLRTDLISGDPPVLRIAGEIDIATDDQLRSALEESLSANPRIVVDMAEVTFIGAAGLRVILQAARSLDGAVPLRLVNAERVAWLLETVGLTEFASLEISEPEATT